MIYLLFFLFCSVYICRERNSIFHHFIPSVNHTLWSSKKNYIQARHRQLLREKKTNGKRHYFHLVACLNGIRMPKLDIARYYLLSFGFGILHSTATVIEAGAFAVATAFHRIWMHSIFIRSKRLFTYLLRKTNRKTITKTEKEDFYYVSLRSHVYVCRDYSIRYCSLFSFTRFFLWKTWIVFIILYIFFSISVCKMKRYSCVFVVANKLAKNMLKH